MWIFGKCEIVLKFCFHSFNILSWLWSSLRWWYMSAVHIVPIKFFNFPHNFPTNHLQRSIIKLEFPKVFCHFLSMLIVKLINFSLVMNKTWCDFYWFLFKCALFNLLYISFTTWTFTHNFLFLFIFMFMLIFFSSGFINFSFLYLFVLVLIFKLTTIINDYTMTINFY